MHNKRYRDAGTGQYVSESYAMRHPGTTVCETLKRHMQPSNKKQRRK
ncbi:multidrug transporter [Legionella geestiana]|nr:multidrug transporter [Legionella geestiana]QBS11457.1 multidrug transporter [Legionella geestiana]QDQ39017.1 multidrug transporter [Legionella geestiana]STX53882.1 multidrug-efflux system transmembrane protein [Legionella geestiana]